MAAISIPAKSTVHKKALLFGLLCALIFIGPNLVLAQSEIPSHEQPSHKPLDTGPVPMFDITPSGAAGMMTAQAPDVTPNPINWTKFVYQTYLTGNWEIFSNTANMMYDHSINVSSHPAADARPNLSARAARIAFNSDRNGDVEIYLMNFDGSAVEQVTYAPGADYAPSWSPDSGSLVFVSERDGNQEIYRIDLASRFSQRLTSDPAADIFATWSPDGSQIAWVKFVGDVGTIWIMNKDGSNPHSIFSGLFLQHPSWSPDGARIAFDADIDGDMMNEIASVRPDGSDLQPIYDTGPGTMEVWMGNWSADGAWIIFTEIWYGIDDGQIWEIDTYIVQIRLSDSYLFFSVNDSVSMLPDWQLMDDQAPVSAVRPLPAYSRASGFAVDWWGSDYGPSGVFGYDIQTRTGPSGVWGDWLPATENTSDEFTGTAGNTIYFRSRAIDNAANVETWPGASGGDTFTTLFTWLLSGTVRDNRSISVPNADILMAPSALSEVGSDAYGHYAAYLATTGDHVASASHPGYGLLNDLKQEMNVDREHTFVLPPKDNLIVNGEFEDHMVQLPGWQTGGILTTAVSTETVYSGDQSALLGENCPAPCLAVPEPFSVDSFMMEPPVLVVDDGGNVAMIWNEHMDKIRYAFRSVTTGWQAPVVVGNNYYGAAKIHMVQDSSGNLFATWGGESVSFIEKTLTGNWSTPIVISQGSNQELLIDQDDNLYSFYVDQDHLAYRKRTPDGIWQPAVAVSVGSVRSDGSSAAIGKDGTIHFLWEDQFDLYYRSLAPDGVLSAVTQLMPEQTVWFNNVIVDSNGNPSVLTLIAENSVEYYQMSSRSPSGNWSDPVRLPFSAVNDLEIDSTDGIHVLADLNNKCNYYYRNPGGQWQQPVALQPEHPCSHTLTIDSQDRIHLFDSMMVTMSYRTSRLASQSDEASVSQPIAVPDAMEDPTLSWLDQSLFNGSKNSEFWVSVDDGLVTREVFSSTATTGWTHAWADMSPWAGQSVTVTFGLEQAANEPLVKVYLDDITLGSWLTPVVAQAEPAVVGKWSTAYITLSGENFIQTPTVKLNAIPAIGVEWQDDNHIRFQLPPGLPVGIYNITVSNPGGQQAVLPGGLQLGYLIYTPLIMR